LKLSPVLILILLFVPVQSHTQFSNQTKEDLPYTTAHGVTVQILSRKISNNFDDHPLGSGAWVGKGHYFITCNHVVKAMPPGHELFAVFIYSPTTTVPGDSLTIAGLKVMTEIPVTIAAVDEQTDVAILHSAEDPILALTQHPAGGINSEIPERPATDHGATLETNGPRIGESLLLAEYPVDGNVLVVQSATATGVLFGRDPNRGNSKILLSLFANKGLSGGPVFNSQGKVVGLMEGYETVADLNEAGNRTVACSLAKIGRDGQIVKGPFGEPIVEVTNCATNSGLSYVVPAKFIAELVKKNNINLD